MEINNLTVYVTAPQLITDPRYTSEAHRAAAQDENAPEGKLCNVHMFI